MRCYSYVCTMLLLMLVAVTSRADTPTTAPAAIAATMPTSAPAVINWDQAKDHVGETVTVTGPVMGSHDFGEAAVLNVGKDFPDATRFTVYLTADARKGVPDDLYEGKTLSVTGKVKIFKKVPEIEADAAHIVVIPPATTAPATQQ